MKKMLATALILGLTAGTRADIVLPKVIASKMVLQAGVEAPVWGWADPGEEVTVEFAGQVQKAVPDDTGKWMTRLAPLPVSSTPRVMTMRGKNELRLEDVLVGEVWLASGQSNMEWTFAQIVPEEWAYAQTRKDNTLLRAFHVTAHVTAGIPLDDTVGQWKSCVEMVSVPHNVSAVGFFFASKLQEELGVPVAFIDANWGGQRIEMFVPKEGYEATGLNFRQHRGNADPKKAAVRLRQLSERIAQAAEAAEQGRRIPYVEDSVYGHSENGIYNAMIAPVTPFAIKGAIWYQGESNRGAPDYFGKLQALSAGWSRVFGVKNIPLYQVQIAPYAYNRAKKDGGDATLCETIWKAQYRGAREIPGMGIVAIHDTNIDVLDIHPKHKRTVGERLAAQALKYQYGKDVTVTGPSVDHAVADGSAVVVSFRDIDQGLTTSDGQSPTWFELSADGHAFVRADAALEGNTVRVSAAGMPTPKYVRMGWDDVAIPNLEDKNGWPVFAFPARPVHQAPVAVSAAEAAVPAKVP